MEKQFAEEVRNYLSALNLDNATKRTLDWAWYYHKNENFYERALHIRKSYNITRSLGEREVNEQDKIKFRDELEQLLLTIQVGGQEVSQERRTLIEVKEIKKHFNHFSKSFSFGPVSITIDRGDIIGVVGENGNGKTTFLRLIQGEIGQDSGEIIRNYNLLDMPASKAYKEKNRTAFIPQRIPRWWGTLMENISFFAAVHGYIGDENIKMVDYVINRMGLTAFKGLSWSQLSSGYKLRFELAKMLVWQPDILILDEPLANLDIQATQNLLEDLRFFASKPVQPVGILLTSQLLHEVESIADKIIFLRNGKEVFSGAVDTFSDKQTKHKIEISIQEDVALLRELFQEKAVSVDMGKNKITLTFDKKIPCNDVLLHILNNGITLKYYRDITSSTVQLFD